MTSLYDKLPADTRDAILTEAAAFSTMLEGDDANAARLMEKAAKLRDAQQTPDKDGQPPHIDRSK